MAIEGKVRSSLSSRLGRAASGRTLALAFAAVAVAFVASTAVSEYDQVEIQRASVQITGNSAPSIQFLAALRGDLVRYTLIVDDVIDRGLQNMPEAPPRLVAGARRNMQESWDSYHALPTFPDERALWPTAEKAYGSVRQGMSRLDDQMSHRDWAGAHETLEKQLKPAADRLDETLLQLVEINAHEGSQLAQRIDWLGRRSVLLAVLLDGISVLLTLLTGLLLWRVLRKYTSITERRAEELELFAGRVAHDVLGPLGAATLALDVAERELPAGGRQARIMASGKAGLQRARTIADGLLEFARACARPQPGGRADVIEVIRAVVEEVQPDAEERGITVQIEAVQPGAVACNAGVLTSVVSNLVRNAVKYVGDGPRRRVTIRAWPADKQVRIEVEDNGRGLPPNLGDQVFEPYVRGPGSKEPGVGLGLATVKKITEAHGGRVDVRSVPGLGCRFGVELPVAPAVPGRPAGRGGRVAEPAPDHALSAP
jgi:signal transduction histidine kinase